jgi:hypothetical protein
MPKPVQTLAAAWAQFDAMVFGRGFTPARLTDVRLTISLPRRDAGR